MMAVPNPTALFCREIGGIYEVGLDSKGNQQGVCILNGKAFPAWELFKLYRSLSETTNMEVGG